MEATVDGATAPKPEEFLAQALTDLANESNLDLATDDELALPTSYAEEVIAAIGIEHADNLLTLRWRILSAKLNHQDDEVKKFAASELASRALLTTIRREHQRAYAIVKWALERRAQNNVRARQEAAAE